jgi:cell division protein FtsL
MSDEQRVSNEQLDKKLESFVEVVLQKMIDLHQEIKTLKKKIHEQEKNLRSLQSNVVDERIGL